MCADAGRTRRRPGRLRVQDARDLEARLVDAAQHAFTRDGYGATSMSAVARAAGISKTTLYAKFPTKAALFRAIVDRQLQRAYDAVEEAAADAPPTLAASLCTLAEKTLESALRPENVQLNRLIEWEAPRFPELAEVAQARARTAIDHIVGYIRTFAHQDGVACEDPNGAAVLFNFTVRGLYHDICIGVYPAAPDGRREAIRRIVNAFLASRAHW